MIKKNNFIEVTILMPVFNSATIVEKALLSIVKQEYPIKKIIVVDNHSSDNSVELIDKFKKRYKKIPLELIKRDRTYSVGSSYNLATKKAKTPFVIFMHSDSVLPTKDEVKKLVMPFLVEKEAVASYPYVEHPKRVWLTYNFWQKCLFAKHVGTKVHSMNGKFDCIRKSSFLRIKGYDEKNFIPGIGSEDANLHYRLEKVGKVIPTNAVVSHLHYLGKNYTFNNYLQTRKLLARTYGRLIRVNWRDLSLQSAFFFVKPALVLLSIFPGFFLLSILLMVILTVITMRSLFKDKLTLLDRKILLIPLLGIFLTYYETFWMMEAFFVLRSRV